jgi:hypothetical protein
MIKGSLAYHLFEKDRNVGRIEGKVKGNLLVADYTFMSEGVESVRQVVFKKEGNSYVEGYGDIENANGKTVYKSLDSLTFSHSIKLSVYDCEVR